MKPVLVHGLRVPVDRGEVSPTIWSALVEGTYEAKEARWAPKAARPGDRILELGAGIGVITSLLASVPDVTVWAFEADPDSADLARRVLKANGLSNVELHQGLLAAGEPREFTFYKRRDLWMSSLVEHQGSYDDVIGLVSQDIDAVVRRHAISLLVMDIEGAELELLSRAELPGVERIFCELHDHLYGLEGIQEITVQLARKGWAYDPRGSRGPCVLFNRDRSPREYCPEDTDA
ncbi:FkbM family methyltransferase [Mycobacterium sp. KBS0706]|uniref:FkbM family methyltransferase n=1 Tax=Mycobacterium sp. KBS0706 TaxID=2578109 RepID=UPI00110FC654|nr:FkbM family methyltransferase [Mycobacterium sp. KBS0706]TSD87015.1 FkbM family methyltransferase [Mycobacterium sp. KBS0706]